MNIYSIISKAYDLLDLIYFSEKGKNPRKVINKLVSEQECCILDMCCGTLSNSIPIAKEKRNAKILGIDLSKDMLKVARRKIKREEIKNIFLQHKDATNTKLADSSFDYVILGLVLHEISPEIIVRMLCEAHRVLKENGTLIVFEWHKPKYLWQRIKYAPMYLLEALNCKTFCKFYQLDKKKLFEIYGFHVEKEELCNYSVVYQLSKTILD